MDWTLIGIILVVLLPIFYFISMYKKRQIESEIGTIKCKRCRHVGPAKGIGQLGSSQMKAVCHKCGSDDWVKVTED
jgi:hypothetical protein